MNDYHRQMRDYDERYAKVERDYADYRAFMEEAHRRQPERAYMPHCDMFVLHAPSANCEYCNNRPDLQQVRRSLGIAFTGEEPLELQRPCPASVLRPVEKIHRWHGNAPMTAEQNKAYLKRQREELERAWQELEAITGPRYPAESTEDEE